MAEFEAAAQNNSRRHCHHLPFVLTTAALFLNGGKKLCSMKPTHAGNRRTCLCHNFFFYFFVFFLQQNCQAHDLHHRLDRNVKYVIVCPEDLKHILFVYPAAHSILPAVVVVVVVVALQLEMLSELKTNSGHSNYDRNKSLERKKQLKPRAVKQ